MPYRLNPIINLVHFSVLQQDKTVLIPQPTGNGIGIGLIPDQAEMVKSVIRLPTADWCLPNQSDILTDRNGDSLAPVTDFLLNQLNQSLEPESDQLIQFGTFGD